ncbi:hypothetical protein CYMTET_43794 [Cymbomonas tetramitiformis]|uniref:Uncharacterized protein n=1 Tax=Cymbomonas tetramitiformis TaxID=36881 RepID=A0AAE0C3E5_9CHLO|nr:hypothetical protein CYMTET_43794 [Cymbomonas tetramitiformis]
MRIRSHEKRAFVTYYRTDADQQQRHRGDNGCGAGGGCYIAAGHRSSTAALCSDLQDFASAVRLFALAAVCSCHELRRDNISSQPAVDTYTDGYYGLDFGTAWPPPGGAAAADIFTRPLPHHDLFYGIDLPSDTRRAPLL